MACQYPQKRNWLTGRCKTPCKNHQAINPRTGRCVTKTYLESLHAYGDISGEELIESYDDDGVYSRNEVVDMEDGYLPRSLISYPRSLLSYPASYLGYESKALSNYRDGLVDDASCYPRKRNLLTGRCKKACEAHQAINPRTGQCVTKSYLMSLDYNLYDVNEEDMMAANLLFSPTIDQSADTNVSDLRKLVMSSALNVADVRTVRGIYLATAETKKVVGHYSPKKRVSCDNSAISASLSSGTAQCGILNVSPVQSLGIIYEKVEYARGDFSWITGYSFEEVASFLTGPVPKDARILVIGGKSVWLILVPKGESLSVNTDFFTNNSGISNSDIASAINAANPKCNVSYHVFGPQTMQ